MHAMFVINLCDRWHKLPEEILAMDAESLKMLKLHELGQVEREEVA